MTQVILLCQFGCKLSTQQWSGYENLEAAMDAICIIFEEQLKHLSPNRKKITYDVTDLYVFMDSLPELSALVFDTKSKSYFPQTKDWLKNQVYEHLCRQIPRK
jgi:hypothetical protein